MPQSCARSPRLKRVFTITAVIAAAAFTLVPLAKRLRLIPLDVAAN